MTGLHGRYRQLGQGLRGVDRGAWSLRRRVSRLLVPLAPRGQRPVGHCDGTQRPRVDALLCVDGNTRVYCGLPGSVSARASRGRFVDSSAFRRTPIDPGDGILAVAIPAILPPPAPFKVFVLLAGVAKVPISQFVTAVALGRGFRYFAEGWLAVRYGEQAETLLVENGAVVSLVLAGTVAAATIAYFLLRNRNRAPEAT